MWYQATMWLTAFGFPVLCSGKTKSVLIGFSNSHVLLMGSITTHKSQTQSGPLIYLKIWSRREHYVVHMQRCMPIGPLATLYPGDPEKFKFCPEGEFGNPLM